MSVVDITDTLADSATLAEIAKRAGITLAQARMVAGMLADLPIRRAVRICTTAQIARIQQSQREMRKR